MQYPKCRILIADDHPPIRHTLRNLLTRYDDIEIIGEAGDGKQAIELVADCRPDLILMDSNMPKMSGIEATSVIRKSWKNTMIIGLCLWIRIRTPRTPFSRQERSRSCPKTGLIIFIPRFNEPVPIGPRILYKIESI